MKSVLLTLFISLLPVSSGFSAALESAERGQAVVAPAATVGNMRGSATGTPDVDAWKQDSDFSILLGWAVHLSTYQAPAKPPSVQFKDHAFFVEHACNGHDCNVLGWYNDTGIVYIDRRLKTEDSVSIQSLLVHEFVHYLQDLSGKYESGTCEDSVEREREAYQIQRDYIMAYGTIPVLNAVYRSCIN